MNKIIYLGPLKSPELKYISVKRDIVLCCDALNPDALSPNEINGNKYAIIFFDKIKLRYFYFIGSHLGFNIQYETLDIAKNRLIEELTTRTENPCVFISQEKFDKLRLLK